ncbi:MAG: alpha amylase N-terminal ig-like domain-containing protein, partial [Leptotrichiaceae bacterium]|nr:alpha amylase N-terminal ig-like domain-containing protein [Leptotrichiaceae bacterium]
MNLLKMKRIILLFMITGRIISFSEGNRISESIAKYSQRDDNYIDTDSLYHDEKTEYRVDEGDKLRIILETKNNDVYSAEVIYGNKGKMMKSIGNYGGKEIFIAEIPNADTDYYFKLTDSKVKYFYGKNIVTSEKSVQKFHYRKSGKLTNVPDWSRGSAGYQIYIDSFRNGNVDNDPIFNEFGTDDFKAPTGHIRSGTLKKDLVGAIWGSGTYNSEFTVNDWNGNYETKNVWEENALNEVKNYSRYYGGDLQGIKEKLDYLKNLGVEYLILSSPLYSLSNHKYDTIYFNHVDPYFGYLEQTGTVKGLDIKAKVHNKNGDKELNLLIYNGKTGKNLLGEDMLDIKTWVWTDSDLELASLVKEAHKKGLKVILEIAPDVTSGRFFAKMDTRYKNWYLDENDLRLDLSNKDVRSYIENSLKKWILGPDETFKSYSDDDGIDGIRYVYYDSRNKNHLISITETLKKYKKDILISGEFTKKFGEDISAGVYDSGEDYNIVNELIKYTVNTNSNYKIGSV